MRLNFKRALSLSSLLHLLGILLISGVFFRHGSGQDKKGKPNPDKGKILDSQKEVETEFFTKDQMKGIGNKKKAKKQLREIAITAGMVALG